MNPSTMTGAVAGAAIPAPGFADAGLVVLARDGDREAREELARRCRGPAYALALQLLGDPDDALDAAQDSLLRLFDSLGRFDPSRPLRPWLARIVRNRSLDLRRRRRARPTLSLDALLDDGLAEAPAAAAGPEERAADRELQRRIWRALREASPAHREILVLRDYQDLSYQEIAAVLAIPVGTVMSRLHADITAALRTLVGGEISEYTKLFAEAREQALDRMVEEAENLGANAVVDVRFSTSMVMSGAAELLAYGTAVVLGDEGE